MARPRYRTAVAGGGRQAGYDVAARLRSDRPFQASSDRDRLGLGGLGGGPDRDSDDGDSGDALRGAGHHCLLEPKDKKQQRPRV